MLLQDRDDLSHAALFFPFWICFLSLVGSGRCRPLDGAVQLLALEVGHRRSLPAAGHTDGPREHESHGALLAQ